MLLIDQLKTICDPRGRRGRRHPLWLVLFLSLLGSMCGYWGYRPLAAFAQEYQASWSALLELPAETAVPSYSTFRQVFLRVDSQSWVAIFNCWSSHQLPAVLGQLSVDGKSIKCTSIGGQSSRQDFAMMVSLYGQKVGVVRLALMFNKKTSEIWVARDLLNHLPALTAQSGCAPTCISLDALHAQVTTLAMLQSQQVPYLVGLKTNQRKLYRQAEQLRETTLPLSYASQTETTRHRKVQRTLKVYAVPDKLPQRWLKTGITQIVWIERKGERDGKAFCEHHCFLSNRTGTAHDYLHHIRHHWQIENGLHWVKDVTFQEDYPPRIGQHAPTSWAVLHSFIISIARRMGARTVPQAMRRLANRIDKVFHWLT